MRKYSIALACLFSSVCFATSVAAATTATTPVAVKGFTYCNKSLGGIDEYRLDSNGLSVLLMPDRSAPVVTFMVTYRVGSRNEVTGTTGATHLLEHLMFKGTPQVQARRRQRRCQLSGAHWRKLQRLDLARPHELLR